MGIYFIIICMGKNIYARDLFLDFNDRQNKFIFILPRLHKMTHDFIIFHVYFIYEYVYCVIYDLI